MKIRSLLLSSVIVVSAGMGLIMAETTLPKVTIMGKTFYYYESKKGETLKDIAERYGWDESILSKTNTEVSGKLAQGTLIYYPASKNSEKTGSKGGGGYDIPDTHTHIVRPGETAYGISRLYNIPIDSLYAMNPAAVNGIKKGDRIIISQPLAASQNSDGRLKDKFAEQPHLSATPSDADQTSSIADNTSSNGYIYHTVEDGESLYGIAHKYSTSIESLFRLNPGLTAGNPSKGEMIRILPETLSQSTHREVIEEKKIDGIAEYKAKRGDSWESIAESHNLTVDALQAANPGISKINKGDRIYLPVVSTVSVEKDVADIDPRSLSSQGVQEIYEEVHSLPAQSSLDIASTDPEDIPSVGIAIVLTDIGQNADEKRSKRNKEMEFSRGAIKAVDDLKNNPFKTRLTIIDGSLPSDSIAILLHDFHPSMIVNTSDTEIPTYLLNYVDSTSTTLVNAFNVKDETYVNNPNIIQFLTPSSYMNSAVSEYFPQEYDGYKLLVAGSPDSSDQLGNMIIQAFAEKNVKSVEELSVEELENVELEDPEGKYLIYCPAVNQADVLALLRKIQILRDRHVLADIRVIGRPNWITFASSSKDVELRDLIGNNRVSIPSRFYFDPEEYATKKFIDDYKGLFNMGPMKASPVYCATAYDIVSYFVPNIIHHKGDFNQSFTWMPTIQSPISLERVSNWGGIVNKAVYVINYQPFGISDKVIVPAIVK